MTTVVPLIEPFGVAIDTKNNIYASDLGGVYRVDPATGQLTTIFSGFPNRPAGIAVDALRHIYVAFPHYHVVRRTSRTAAFRSNWSFSSAAGIRIAVPGI